MENVTDIMRPKENIALAQKNSCVRDVLEIMNAKKMGAVCIIDEDELVGIITDGDLRRLILKTQDTLPDFFMKRAENIMITEPKTIRPDASSEECLQLLVKHRFWVVPVVNKQNQILGMVHMQDLVESLIGREL